MDPEDDARGGKLDVSPFHHRLGVGAARSFVEMGWESRTINGWQVEPRSVALAVFLVLESVVDRRPDGLTTSIVSAKLGMGKKPIGQSWRKMSRSGVV